MRFSHETGDRRFSVLGPPLMRKSPVSCLMRKSHVSRENLMSFQFWAPPNEKISCLLSHEKISCLISLGPPPTRKSPVSCLMRKSHFSRENLMSYQFRTPLTRKSPVSCLMRKSRVSLENLMSHPC